MAVIVEYFLVTINNKIKKKCKRIIRRETQWRNVKQEASACFVILPFLSELLRIVHITHQAYLTLKDPMDILPSDHYDKNILV
jgi:hypothetical protein